MSINKKKFNSYLVNVPTFKDSRGQISIYEDLLNFKIKRVFYIYDIKKNRGYHKNMKTKQFLVCLKGKIQIQLKNKNNTKSYLLSKPSIGLYLSPADWHIIVPKSKNPVLLSICSKKYSKSDYNHEI